ncbi:MAG: asparagine synthase (glutamine-hydrolyzing), partial [Anaerolineae bacterium]|nr:asparagine synthase (glutamine-hydrolyzing) [Anaerolineae bacterium]
LARDRLGVKPLFYALLPDRLLFASEIKAIRADFPPLTVDPMALNHYLSLLYIPAPESVYRQVRKLEPGHLLTWQQGRVSIQQYWDLASVQPLPSEAASDALAEELRALLADAVGRQLVADVPVGVFLSGGLDSSTVAAFARLAHRGPLRTFCVGFDDPSYDETAHARLVAERLGTEHSQAVVRPDPLGIAQELCAHFDEPFADASAVPTYYLCQFARQQVTVALAGDGGDELFAGYLTYQADKLARLYDRLPGFLSRGLIPAAVRRLPISDARVSFDFRARRFVEHALLEPGERHYAWKAFLSPTLKRSLLVPDLLDAVDGDLDGYGPYRRHHLAAAHLDDISRFQYADAMVYLPDDNLIKVDHMSMAHSLEVRVPFLDHRVAEFAFRLPGRLKMPGLRLKHFLRQTMRGMLPEETLRRPKRGFNVPTSRWLKADLRPLVEEYLSPETVQRQGYFRPEMVARLVREHATGLADHAHCLWALLMFGLWAERASAPLDRAR